MAKQIEVSLNTNPKSHLQFLFLSSLFWGQLLATCPEQSFGTNVSAQWCRIPLQIIFRVLPKPNLLYFQINFGSSWAVWSLVGLLSKSEHCGEWNKETMCFLHCKGNASVVRAQDVEEQGRALNSPEQEHKALLALLQLPRTWWTWGWERKEENKV